MATKVLYVEDELFLGKIVQESLESRGFEVQMVGDGAEVLAVFENFMPDICLLDVMLPNRNGYELGEDIRQRFPTLPIIFLTAKTQTEDVLKGFTSGGNDYIRKPFSMEELIARIHNLLNLSGQNPGETGGEQNGIIHLGKYVFDLRKYELRFQAQVRKLSHREAELLKILADHRNFTVERKVIMLQIWGDDSFFNSRNLDVYITRLRDYLREDERVQIITLKGVGYQFIVD
ncbi:response regulator transcription factor [Haliscomenobacter sp.]|uniref:response regulator transcription factor n=1 Tax=Haliscomenobacter sp. TaxID=2717303 RepID=UPI00359308C6